MTTVRFDNQVVIVTGAGGGLGRSYALDIARRGGAVVVNDLGGSVKGPGASSEAADRVVAEIKAAGGSAVANYDSVATRDGAQRIVDAAMKAFGRVDALINNAGNMRVSSFEDASDEDLSSILSVHLVGTFNVTQAVWPQMRAQGYGRVVFTSSSAGMYGNELYACYAAAKAGVIGLMNVLAHEGKSHGILCNALMPNAFSRMTDMVEAELTQTGNGGSVDSAAFRAIVKNSMSPTFTTGLAVYLASAACTSTKAIYSSCAGRMARVFIGATEGWHGSIETPAAAEDIAAHIDEICDQTRGLHTPISPSDEFRIALSRSVPLA